MLAKSSSFSALHEENAELRARLDEANEMLGAIRGGEVDALVVQSADGPKVYALQGQDAENNRFRGEMLAQVSDAVIAADSEERVIYLNLAAERLYGFDASEALGRPLSEIYQSRWPQLEDRAVAKTILDKCGEWRGECIHILRDGREMNVEAGAAVLRDTTGLSAGTLSVVRDVTGRKRHEDEVLVSEVRYRRLFEAARDGILILDPATGKIIDANPVVTQMLGCPDTRLVGKTLFEVGLLTDDGVGHDMVAELKRANQIRFENLPFESPSGRHHDVEFVANLYSENDRPVIQCNIRDITERRRSEEHVKLLMAEVNHRAKNMLAVVQAVAYQTAKFGDPATLADRLSGRIGALAAGQDLLVKSQWQGVEVADLITAQLAHFKDLMGARVLADGPPALLTAEAAQGIGMALHELATNAAKYGALSNSEGRVRIVWQIIDDPKPTFSISWLEEGGPRAEASGRRGFGQIVMGRMAEAAVQGVARITYGAGGLAWTLTAPLDDALATAKVGP